MWANKNTFCRLQFFLLRRKKTRSRRRDGEAVLPLSILGVLLLGTIAFVATNRGGNSSSDDGSYQHGRGALRMDVLHRAVGGQQRVSSSSQLQHQRLVDPRAQAASACKKGLVGVEVSGITLKEISSEDGALLWKSRSDPYVVMNLGSGEKRTPVKMNKKQVVFHGPFCFPGVAAVAALKQGGLTVRVMDSDSGELLGELCGCDWLEEEGGEEVVPLGCPTARFCFRLR